MNKYYCLKCNKNHLRGKIYKEHLKYKGLTKESEPPLKIKQDKINLKEFRPVARRQLKRLLHKMKITPKKELYKNEINKLIEYESGLSN